MACIIGDAILRSNIQMSRSWGKWKFKYKVYDNLQVDHHWTAVFRSTSELKGKSHSYAVCSHIK